MSTCRINEIFIDPELTLIVLETVELQTTTTKTSGFLLGNIAPIAVVVCRPDGTTALDMQAMPASVEHLRREFPELDAALSA